MDTPRAILQRLNDVLRSKELDEFGPLTFDVRQRLRSYFIARDADGNAWAEFVDYLGKEQDVAVAIRVVLEDIGWIACCARTWDYQLTLPNELPPLSLTESKQFLDVLDPWPNVGPSDAQPIHAKVQAGEILFVEQEGEVARVVRVTRSGSGKTIYFDGYKLKSLKGAGSKCNYQDQKYGFKFWVSKCRKDGNDTLRPGIVEIDDDAREEYWSKIRGMPGNSSKSTYRSDGKHSKRRPT